MTKKVSVRMDVGEIVPAEAAQMIAADIFVPAGAVRFALYCLPGGGVNRQYFDLAGEGMSFARAMAARGALVVTIDHAGVGESSEPTDRYKLSAFVVALANARACAAIATGLKEGTLVEGLAPLAVPFSIGVGHSMGAMLTVLQAVAAPMHRALALLCFSTRGLPEVLNEYEALAELAPDHGRGAAEELARIRFVGDPRKQGMQVEGSSPASLAMVPVQDKMLETSAILSMLPNNVSPEAAQIKIPVFLGVGERDFTGRPERIPKAFSACRDVTLYVLPGAGHHLFVSAGRAELFARMAAWFDDIERGVAPAARAN